MAETLPQPADPFEAALAEFETMLVDLNGDGRPDAVVQQPQQGIVGRMADKAVGAVRDYWGEDPSGNYAAGPLPDYFADRQKTEQTGSMMSAGIAGAALGATAIGAPPLLTMPYAIGQGAIAVNDWARSRALGRGADMWSDTGMPQQPPAFDGMMRLGGPQPQNALVRASDVGAAGGDPYAGTMVPPMPVRNPNALMPGGAPQTPAPQQNALMREPAGPPNPNVRIPFSDNGQTIPGQVPGQVAPAPNALARYGQRVVSDVADDPLGAALGLLEFAGGGGATVAGEAAATNALMRGAPGATRRTLREVTSEGRRRNRADDYRLEVRRHNDALDWADLPSHTLQPRDAATGRFGKLPEDIAKMRAQGREITRQQRDFVKRYEKKYGAKPRYDEEGQLIPPKGWFDNAP